MLLLHSDDVGAVALRRMASDRIVEAATATTAFPADILPSPSLRALCIAQQVPGHTVLSGLAGLWVWHGGQWPGKLCVVGARGLHRTTRHTDTAGRGPNSRDQTGTDPVNFHSGVAWSDAGVRVGAIRVATPGRCCIDSLRWEDHRLAVPAVAKLVSDGLIDVPTLLGEWRRDSPQGAGYGRLRHMWGALYPVLRELRPAQ